MKKQEIQRQIDEILNFGRSNTDSRLIALAILILSDVLENKPIHDSNEINRLRGWRQIAHKTIKKQQERIKSLTDHINKLTSEYNDVYDELQMLKGEKLWK